LVSESLRRQLVEMKEEQGANQKAQGYDV